MIQDFLAGAPRPLLVAAVAIAGSAALYLLVRSVGERFVRRMQQRDGESGARALTLWKVMRRILALVLVILVVLVVLNEAGVALGPFLAVGTVVGAAIGFGAQHLVRDLLAGFFILAENQYHVGDTVRIADTEGTVEDIQFRVTVLRDYEGNVHYVPNGAIVVTSNYTSVYAKPVIEIGVAYSTDIDRAMKIIGDELRSMAESPEWSDVIQEEVEVLGVQRLDDSAVILRARLTTRADDRWKVRREALRRLKNRFDAEGVVIPFPQLTIHRD